MIRKLLFSLEDSDAAKLEGLMSSEERSPPEDEDIKRWPSADFVENDSKREEDKTSVLAKLVCIACKSSINRKRRLQSPENLRYAERDKSKSHGKSSSRDYSAYKIIAASKTPSLDKEIE